MRLLSASSCGEVDPSAPILRPPSPPHPDLCWGNTDALDGCYICVIVLGIIGVLTCIPTCFCLWKECRMGRGWWQKEGVVYRAGVDDAEADEDELDRAYLLSTAGCAAGGGGGSASVKMSRAGMNTTIVMSSRRGVGGGQQPARGLPHYMAFGGRPFSQPAVSNRFGSTSSKRTRSSTSPSRAEQQQVQGTAQQVVQEPPQSEELREGEGSDHDGEEAPPSTNHAASEVSTAASGGRRGGSVTSTAVPQSGEGPGNISSGGGSGA